MRNALVLAVVLSTGCAADSEIEILPDAAIDCGPAPVAPVLYPIARTEESVTLEMGQYRDVVRYLAASSAWAECMAACNAPAP